VTVINIKTHSNNWDMGSQARAARASMAQSMARKAEAARARDGIRLDLRGFGRARERVKRRSEEATHKRKR